MNPLDEYEQKMAASSLGAYIVLNGIKTENGQPVDFHTHRYLVDIYEDESKNLVVLKAAQIGLSTLQIFRSLWRAFYMGLDIIYVLPTFTDIKDFVSGKVNRIIDQNPALQSWVADKDSIEQKRVGKATIYYRGSFAERQALMISADELVLDEYDRSDQSVLETYESRLQHSRYGYKSVFSNPSTPGRGVDLFYQKSDQKKWYITHSCGKTYILTEACVDYAKEEYICPECKQEITDEERRTGEWKETQVAQDNWSGYWIPLWINPLVPASKIAEYKRSKTNEYFNNFVAGLPYVSTTDSISSEQVLANCIDDVNPMTARVVIGVDPGLPIWYVCMNKDGIFHADHCNSFKDIEALLRRWPTSVMVIDQGGEPMQAREMLQKYPGRVYLAYYRPDRKSVDVVQWGTGNEYGKVVVDRNRMISLLVEQFKDKGRISINGIPEDWREYGEHFGNIYRELVVATEKPGRDSANLYNAEYVWKDGGRPDHFVHATLYAVVALDHYSEGITFVKPNSAFEGIPHAADFDAFRGADL